MISRIEILLLCFCLTGCSFDWFGKSDTPQTPSNATKQTEEISAFGDVMPCVSDDQCEQGLICYKDKSQESNDTGRCGHVDLKLKEYKP
jgi:hypothetical protein